MSIGSESLSGFDLFFHHNFDHFRSTSQISSYLKDVTNPPSQSTDDRNWSWTYLRKQFQLRNLERLYLQYQQRLHRGYFSVFLLLQLILSVCHVVILLANHSVDPTHRALPDIASYVILALLLWPLVALVFKQSLVKKYKWLPMLISCIVVLARLTVDLGLPIYHTIHSHSDVSLRPAYVTHTLLACYIFLPLQDNVVPAVLGLTVTVCHLITLATITYRNTPESLLRQLASDAVFLLCVNGLGLYFRFVNEVVIRRTFLDRRACVESTLKLNYEKEQEEQLMLSILPRHIASRVRDDLRKLVMLADNGQSTPLTKKPLHEMYVEKHENVSILYADVVNYTKMTSTLPVTKLVETLNELFGRFDEASEEHRVLRIKFLGDCYYCVAGVPQPNPNHAKSCVNLGLDMITIIKDVRERRNLDIDMRIGVHSGNILSGLLGRRKWQYDVWSKDVIIANHMEQTGKPGMVHVTKQTLNRLDGEYEYEPADGAKRDELLAKYNIETFLICPTKRNVLLEAMDSSNNLSVRSLSGVSRHYTQVKRPWLYSAVYALSRRRTAFMDHNLFMYQERLKMADVLMERAIEKLPLGKYDQWFHKEQIHPLCLTFQENGRWEIPFLKQPDPLFKYYVASAVIVLVCMLGIQILGLPSWNWVAWLGFALTAVLLISLLPLTWAHSMWNAYKDPHQEIDHIPQPDNKLLRFVYKGSSQVIRSACIRTLLYLVICFLLAICAMTEMVQCLAESSFHNQSSRFKRREGSESSGCIPPWQMTETTSLAILMSFLFLRIHFQLKLLIGLIIGGVYILCFWSFEFSLFENGTTWNPDLEPRLAHTINIVFLVISLHLMDRQAEYMNRLDYRWKRQLSAEKDEAGMTRMVNQLLLQNILPIHVAEVYLNTNRAYNELYHENYDSVAVMFASLTNYTLYEEEIRSLQVLNQIICDFDSKLGTKAYRRVEKIKVAGWTYMAACGLDPGRRESNTNNNKNCSRINNNRTTTTTQNTSEQFVLILTKFAADMMRGLHTNNIKNSKNFKLRIGISHGPIAAGVVGSQKPLYDIWGDAVNMASRMDSTGEADRIQVPESTATILRQQGIQCTYRGLTPIKNKTEPIPTYFVNQDSQYCLKEDNSSLQSNDSSETINTKL